MIQRVTPARLGSAVARCPACDSEVTFSDAGGRVGTPVRTFLQCPCGRRFTVLLERRAAVRREVVIPGALAAVRTDRGRPITILNLSRTGVLFRDSEAGRTTVGDTLWIRFALDPASGHSYNLRSVVVRLEARGVAAEFTDLHGRDAAAYDLALALYQQPAAAPR